MALQWVFFFTGLQVKRWSGLQEEVKQRGGLVCFIRVVSNAGGVIYLQMNSSVITVDLYYTFMNRYRCSMVSY